MVPGHSRDAGKGQSEDSKIPNMVEDKLQIVTTESSCGKLPTGPVAPLALRQRLPKILGRSVLESQSGYLPLIFVPLLIDIQNQRKFLDWAAERLGIHARDGWYLVSILPFTQIEGASSLLSKYGSSLPVALKSVYSDHQWEEWRFTGSLSAKARISQEPLVVTPAASSVPVQPPPPLPVPPAPSPAAPLSPKAQRDADPHYDIRSFMTDIGNRLGVKQLDDWYRISTQQLSDAGAMHILIHFGGLPGVLKMLYPSYRWNNKVFALAAKRAVQRQLRIRLEMLFPEHEVIEEYNLGINYNRKGRVIGFDAYVPSLKLAFEYQGEVHFRDIQSVGQSRTKQDNDAEKAAVCTRQGITLIEVPYTWGTNFFSLCRCLLF